MNHPDASASYVASVVTLYLEMPTRHASQRLRPMAGPALPRE